MGDPQVKLVLVTGSGRSGTSSVAGTLKRLGLYIPQPEVETDERNPRGYYEPLWLAELQKRLLNPIPVRTIDSRPNAGKIAKKHVTPKVEDRAAGLAARAAQLVTTLATPRSRSRTPAPTGSTTCGSGWPPSSAPS